MKPNVLSNDLDYILENTPLVWDNLRNQRIFITGGTGFFGCWLLESFVWANEQLHLNATAVVLTRNKAQFEKKCPHLASNPALIFQEGDVTNFSFPEGHFSDVIHAATEASVSLDKNHPELMRQTIVEGTRHTLEFAKQCGAKRFLLTSSGAVYGKTSQDSSSIQEDHFECTKQLTSAYAQGKRDVEIMCMESGEKYPFEIKIARCFAFVGPYLPLDTHFAIGNFIRDGLNADTIVVNSDGSSIRSYLYAADLTIWLWTILFHGENRRPYNVGSDQAISIKDLALLIGSMCDLDVHVQASPIQSNLSVDGYVPDVSRVRDELNLVPSIQLREAIQSTQDWYSQQQSRSI